jgi:hypothetical protein
MILAISSMSAIAVQLVMGTTSTLESIAKMNTQLKLHVIIVRAFHAKMAVSAKWMITGITFANAEIVFTVAFAS